MVRRGRVIMGGAKGGREKRGWVMEEARMGWRGGGGSGVALARRGNGGRGGGWGSAAGAARPRVWRAKAWRACGVEGGGSHGLIFSGRTALSRYRLCPVAPPISRWASRSREYIDQFGMARKMNNEIQVDH